MDDDLGQSCRFLVHPGFDSALSSLDSGTGTCNLLCNSALFFLFPPPPHLLLVITTGLPLLYP